MEIGTWLVQNLDSMSEDMFFAPIDWERLQPVDMFFLRAVSTREVFTDTAKAGYLGNTSGLEHLSGLASVLFTDDTTFLKKVPTESRFLLTQLMNWAKDIRRG